MKQIGFIGAVDGSVVKYEPRPATREERFEAYYEGIRRVRDRLKEIGFIPHHEADYSVSMEYKGILFDYRIQIPDNVAHVTSSRESRPDKHKTLTYRLRDEIKSEYCLQLIVGMAESMPPTYIPLDENLVDPATFIYRTVMGFLAALGQHQHRLGDALQHLPNDQKQIPDWIEI